MQQDLTGAGRGSVTGAVPVGSQREVKVPASLQTHRLCRHLQTSKGYFKKNKKIGMTPKVTNWKMIKNQRYYRNIKKGENC